ncbi:MAG: hypothetical protein V4501_11970 [Pseudomonadota bacterium]
MFSLSWLWGSKPQQIDKEVDVIQEKAMKFSPEDYDENDIYLLPASQLKILKQKKHTLEKRTYYFINTPKGELQLYCVDRGEEKWARKIEIDKDFLNRVRQIDPLILTQVDEKINLRDALIALQEVQEPQNPALDDMYELIDIPKDKDLVESIELSDDDDEYEEEIPADKNPKITAKLAKLRDLLSKEDGILFKVVTEKTFNSKELFKNIVRDTYFLVQSKQGLYQLYYYNAAKKTKIPLLAFEDSTQTFDSLADLKSDAADKSLFDDVSISEEGLAGFTGMLKNILYGKKLFYAEDLQNILERQAKLNAAGLNKILKGKSDFTAEIRKILVKYTILTPDEVNELIKETADRLDINIDEVNFPSEEMNILLEANQASVEDQLEKLLAVKESFTLEEVKEILVENANFTPAEVNLALKEKANFTGDDLKRMRDFLNYYHEPLPTPNIYLSAKTSVIKIRTHVEDLLANIIEPFYYDKYFRNAEKSKTGLFVLPAVNSENAKIVNYMRFHNMLVNMEIFFEKTSKLHLQTIQPFDLYNTIIKSPKLYADYTEWLASYNELYAYIEPLGAMTLLRNLSSVSGLNHELQKIIPFNLELGKQQLTTNPFYLSHLNQGESWIAMLKGTDDKINALKAILNDFNKNLPKGGQASDNIQRTINDINKIILEFDNLKGSPKSLLDVLKFVYEVYPKIQLLINELPKSYISLQTVFKDHLLMTAQQLNLIFRDAVLNLDQFEIEYHLKTGTLSSYEFADGISLKTMLESFNEAIEKTGYELKPEERYPYSLAILNQRKLMLTYPNTPKELLISRIKSAEQTVESQSITKKHSAEITHVRKRFDTAENLIAIRIANLKDEQSFWSGISGVIQQQLNLLKKGLRIIYLESPFKLIEKFATGLYQWLSSNVRDKKITLLSKLRMEIAKTNSLDTALQSVSLNNPLDRKKMPMLWQGRTGKILRQIQLLSDASPQEIIRKIDLEINKLKESRDQRILFFIKFKRSVNEARILALEKLRKLMVKPGFPLDEALRELNATNPEEYQTLLRRDLPFINELMISSDLIPKAVYGNKVIDYIDPANTKLHYSPREVHLKYGYVKNEIDKRILELTNELTHTFFSKDIKEQKILLLNELKLQLNTRTLDAALENIASNKQFRSTFYLLHEGRTGTLMNKLELSEVTPSEKSKYVDYAISRLKKMRSQEYSLFSEQEQFIEDRIYALAQLKDQLIRNPNSSLTNVTANLFPEQKTLLFEYEQELFEKLRQWDVINLTKQEYQVVNTPPPPIMQVVRPNIDAVQLPKPMPEQPPEIGADANQPSFYESTIASIKSLETTTEHLFQSMLNNNVYQEFFADADKDEEGRFIIRTKSLEPGRIQDYKKFYNLLINARILFEKLDKTHAPIIEYYYGKNQGLMSLAAKFPALYSNMHDLTSAYYDLYNDVDDFDVFSFIEKISTASGVQKQLSALMPPKAAAHTQQFANNPFFQALNQHDKIFFEAVDLNQRLDSIQELLLSFEDKLPASPLAREAAKKTVDDILSVLKEVREFSKSPCKLYDALKLVYNIYPHLNTLTNNSAQTYGTLNELLKEQLSTTIQALNLVFRDIMLGIDRFKVTNFLTDTGPAEITTYEFQKGISINNVLASFNQMVDDFGYEFKPEERPPYATAIINQRQGMLFENQLPRDYIVESINSAIKISGLADKRTLRQHMLELAGMSNQKHSAITALLNQRIDELTVEKDRWYNFFKTKDIKISLLTDFKEKIKHFPFDRALKMMQRNPLLRENMHQLGDGRTGIMMLEIQKVSSTTDDILDLIDHEITRINHASHRLFSLETRKDFEKSIKGLELLKSLLSKQGYRIGDALSHISGKYPEEYQLLISRQTPLINQITEINSYIANSEIGKKVIDNFKSSEEADIDVHARLGITERYAESSYVQQKITQQIGQLKNELEKSTFRRSETKQVRIALLTELKEQLKNHSLSVALENIAKNKKFAKTYRQLFAGRTGMLIKKLETIVLPPTGIKKRIEAEIAFLKLNRGSKSTLFKNEERLQQEHIQILEDLKDTLQKNPQHSISVFLDNLSEPHREIIKKDSTLLNDIREWQTAQLETVSHSRKAVPPAA